MIHFIPNTLKDFKNIRVESIYFRESDSVFGSLVGLSAGAHH